MKSLILPLVLVLGAAPALADPLPAELAVPVNKSHILRVDQPFAQVSVGNPKIADLVVLNDRSLYVLGREAGATNVTLYDSRHQPLGVVDVVVGFDADGLKTRLHDVMPAEHLEVRPGRDALILGGQVSSNQQLTRALAVAEGFAPGHVTNLLAVKGSQQVMLAVRVAEVSRTVARQLGLKPDVAAGDFTFSTIDPLNTLSFGSADLFLKSGHGHFSELVDALEQKGAVRTLAEPNLICLSGDTANFLAGGEFPVPVAQTIVNGQQTITIVFKQFGVSLAFTPTVVDRDLINLMVAPEVSQLDKNNAIILNGFNIPALSTRRAKTTVELHDGQSFAVAGLIQDDFTDQVRQWPGIGDLPILGALARSSSFQTQQTELVIMVTAHLVHPVSPDQLSGPGNGFSAPDDFELFGLGRSEGDAAKGALRERAGGGLDGPHGQILW